ncbi:glycosyltransferase [Paenibacillus sp. JTLBN-2024]
MIVFIVSKGSYTEMIQTEISVKEAFPEARVERLPEMNPGKVLNEILAVCRGAVFLALYGGDTFTPAIKEELMSRIADMHPETGAVVLHPKGRSRPGSKQGFDAPHGILWRTAAVTPSAYGGFSESSHLPFSVYLWIERLFPASPGLDVGGSGNRLKASRFLPKRFAPEPRPLHQRLTMTSLALLRQPLEPPGPKHSENLSDPVISVVICTYNDAAYLPWAVRSVACFASPMRPGS